VGDPGPSTRQRNIPSQIEVPVSSNPIGQVSGVSSSDPSGPSELEKLPALCEIVTQHPWMRDLVVNPGLIGIRPQRHDGAEDTPSASLSMFCDKCPLAPPATPLAGLDHANPKRLIEHPSPVLDVLSPTTNMSPTQPPDSVIPPACRSPIPSSAHTSKTLKMHLKCTVP